MTSTDIYHYVYCTFDTEYKQFYIGRHSTRNLEDGYQGSGTWVAESISRGESLVTIKVAFFDDFESLKAGEEYFINGLWHVDGRKNRSRASQGFGPGSLNIAFNVDTNIKKKETAIARYGVDHWSKSEYGRRFLSENNPSKRDDVKKLRSFAAISMWENEEYRRNHSGDNHWTSGNEEYSKWFSENNPMSNPISVEKIRVKAKEQYKRELAQGRGIGSSEIRAKSTAAAKAVNVIRMTTDNPMKREEVKAKARNKLVVFDKYTNDFVKVTTEEYLRYKSVRYLNRNSREYKELKGK